MVCHLSLLTFDSGSNISSFVKISFAFYKRGNNTNMWFCCCCCCCCLWKHHPCGLDFLQRQDTTALLSNKLVLTNLTLFAVEAESHGDCQVMDNLPKVHCCAILCNEDITICGCLQMPSVLWETILLSTWKGTKTFHSLFSSHTGFDYVFQIIICLSMERIQWRLLIFFCSNSSSKKIGFWQGDVQMRKPVSMGIMDMWKNLSIKLVISQHPLPLFLHQI